MAHMPTPAQLGFGSKVLRKSDMDSVITEGVAFAGDGTKILFRFDAMSIATGFRFGGLRGLRIDGDASYANVLNWQGGADSVFEFDQCQYGGVGNLIIQQDTGYAGWTEAILLTDTRTDTPSHPESNFTTTVRSESGDFGPKLLIDGLGVGLIGVNIKLGSATDAKNDQHTFRGVRVRGMVTAGFNVEGQAARNIYLDDCRIQGYVLTDPTHYCAAGICSSTQAGHGGSVHMVAGLIMNNRWDVDIGDRSGPWTFTGVWFEQSKGWIRALDYRAQDSSQVEYLPVSLTGCRWSGETGVYINPVIDCRVWGLSFRNCQIGPNNPTEQFEVFFDAPYGNPSAAGDWSGTVISVPNRFKFFRGRYPTKTRMAGTIFRQGTTSADVFEAQSHAYDGSFFKPNFPEDLVDLGLRYPRALHCFEEKQYLSAWTADTTYTSLYTTNGYPVEVYNYNGSNAWGRYRLITIGTTASSTGPTTTASDITDGTAHWKYIGDGQFVVFDRQTKYPQLPLYAYGTPTLDNTVTPSTGSVTGPWATCSETADKGLSYNESTSLLQPSAKAILVTALIHTTTSAGTLRGLYSIGGEAMASPGGPWIGMDASERLELQVDNLTVTGTHTYTNETFLIAILWDPDTAGSGAAARFLVVTLNPVTGATIESLTASANAITAMTGGGSHGLGNAARKGWGAAADSRTSMAVSLRWDAMWIGRDAVAFGGATSLADLLGRFIL